MTTDEWVTELASALRKDMIDVAEGDNSALVGALQKTKQLKLAGFNAIWDVKRRAIKISRIREIKQ